MPVMALSGVRISCDMLARNELFATLAFSAASLASDKAAVRWTKLELPPARQAVKLIPADDPAKAAEVRDFLEKLGALLGAPTERVQLAVAKVFATS